MGKSENAGRGLYEPVDKELIVNERQIVVTTNCLYRNYRALQDGKQRNLADIDGIRGDLALELFSRTINSGACIVVCDGGSSPQFRSTLERFEDNRLTLVHSDTPERGPQRRNAFETATLLPSKRVIIYTQPEKVSLIDYLVEISRPILVGNADIVIPKRNPELFEQSYPEYMRESEIRVNKTYDYLMQRAGLMEKGESFDWFFGPVAFKNDPEIVALFLKKYTLKGPIRSRIGVAANPEMHSDGHYFPVIEALFRKKRVVSEEVPFVYPELQRQNETSPAMMAAFRERRQQDASAYRLEAIHFLEFLKGNPKSRIVEIIDKK